MDSRFTQSFIPKKPIVAQGRVDRVSHGQREIVPFVGVVVFVIALFGSVGVFAYQQYLVGRIESLKSNLEEARSTLDSEIVNNLTSLDSRLASAKNLLLKHVSTVAFFELLQSLTVQNVQFTSFDYTTDTPEGGIKIGARGKAKNYTTLVLQSDILNKSEKIKQSTFTSIDLDGNGNVVFKLDLVVDAKSLLYKDSLQSLSLNGSSY